ncbi:hypothetical protein PENSPDRAFT_751232 [Peniophora sp. CONT]|nr:hypothetical protein PENSPDRAFT_751232 [Peniophora sp. CONT]
MSTEALVRDELFYFHSVVFQAENRLFRVPRYGLPGDATVFDTMFGQATGGGAGSSDDNPIRLDADVSAADFLSLLKTASPPHETTVTALNFDEWMGVLNLANKWNLQSTKDKAVAGSDADIQKKTVTEKILLAKKYGVAKWLKEGYCALASRKEPITPEEREQLGWETYGRLMSVRERGRETSLDGLHLLPDTWVNCNTCGIMHVPLCSLNVSGGMSGKMRSCSSGYCGDGSSVYHYVGCAAGLENTTQKDRILAHWAGFNFDDIVKEEFGALVNL